MNLLEVLTTICSHTSDPDEIFKRLLNTVALNTTYKSDVYIKSAGSQMEDAGNFVFADVRSKVDSLLSAHFGSGLVMYSDDRKSVLFIKKTPNFSQVFAHLIEVNALTQPAYYGGTGSAWVDVRATTLRGQSDTTNECDRLVNDLLPAAIAQSLDQIRSVKPPTAKGE